MRMRRLALMLAALAPVPALAAEPSPCPATPVPPPAELVGWADASRQGAGRTGTAAPLVPVGKPVDLALLPIGGVRFAAAPGKTGEPDSQGGIVRLDIARAGTYRIALSGPAWIDVVRSGKASVSVAHAHGPACSGIRKLVDYRLTPGRHDLQIAGSRAASVRVMVVALP